VRQRSGDEGEGAKKMKMMENGEVEIEKKMQKKMEKKMQNKLKEKQQQQEQWQKQQDVPEARIKGNRREQRDVRDGIDYPPVSNPYFSSGPAYPDPLQIHFTLYPPHFTKTCR